MRSIFVGCLEAACEVSNALYLEDHTLVIEGLISPISYKNEKENKIIYTIFGKHVIPLTINPLTINSFTTDSFYHENESALRQYCNFIITIMKTKGAVKLICVNIQDMNNEIRRDAISYMISPERNFICFEWDFNESFCERQRTYFHFDE